MKKPRTAKELADYIKNNPSLNIYEKVDLIDNLPELTKKIKELEKYYNKLVDKALEDHSDDEIEEYSDGRVSMISEDPGDVTVYDGLWL